MVTSSNCTFTNSRGHELHARLERPTGALRGAALFAHCFTCGKDLKAERQLTRALTAQGFAVLSFDFAGLGRSGGDFADSSFSADVADLHAAADYLADSVVAPTLLVGHSLGGAAVLSAAASIPGVRAVATIGAPADPGHVQRLLDGDLDAVHRDGAAPITIAGRTFTVGRSFLEDLHKHSPQSSVAGFTGATLILHAPGDNIVSIANAETLYHAAKHPKSFVSLDNADHLLTDDADATYAAAVIAAWASRYLAGGTDGAKPKITSGDSVIARNHGGFSTTLESRGFRLIADEPKSSGGTAEGPSPYDFLSMALAACTTMTVRSYAERKGWSLGEIQVRVNHRRLHADDCRDCEHTSGRIDRFDLELQLPTAITDEQGEALARIAGRCPVHQTLRGQIEVRTTVAASVPN
ncbi:bifunctional alpha/beta hydrolase/OsmC family protein [Micromonospora chokoriensis]